MYCCLCKQDKDLEEFTSYQQTRKSGNQCQVCVKFRSKQHYSLYKKRYKQISQEWRKTNLKIIQNYVISYLKTHPCRDCGESDIVVLEFDHLSKEDKLGSVTSIMYVSRSLELVKSEIEKCEVVCANCHTRRTARRSNSLRYQLSLLGR